MLTHVKPAVTLIIALLKRSQEKKHAWWNVGNSERGVTFTGLNPQNSYYINCTSWNSKFRVDAQHVLPVWSALCWQPRNELMMGEKVRNSVSDALIEVCCIDSTVYSSSSCAPLFMEHLASNSFFLFKSLLSILMPRFSLESDHNHLYCLESTWWVHLKDHIPDREPSSSQQVWLPPVSSATYSR